MAMGVSRNSTLALSVSADHLVGRYDLKASVRTHPHVRSITEINRNEQNAPADTTASCTIARTKHPGNAAIAIHDSDKVCALGGWDGKYVLPSLPLIPSPQSSVVIDAFVSTTELISLFRLCVS